MATSESYPSLNSLITSLPFQKNDYIFLSVIDVGGSSVVFKVKSLLYESTFFAAKVIPKSMKEHAADLNVLKYLVNPYIILVYDFFEDDHNNYIIIEFCPNGSLSSLIKFGYLKSQREKVFYMKRLADAICFCHSKGIAHRDIKPKNVLLDDHGNPKLIDFGICEMLYFNPDSINNDDTNDGYYNAGKKGKIQLINKYFGTCPYLAPEIILNEPYDPFAADIWSLGVTFFEIETGYLPWNVQSEKEMKNLICQGSIFYPDSISIQMQYLIKSMLQVDPYRRPTMKTIIRFPLFQNSISTSLDFKNHFRIFSSKIAEYNYKRCNDLQSEKIQKGKNVCETNINESKIKKHNSAIILSLNTILKPRVPYQKKKNRTNGHIHYSPSYKTECFSRTDGKSPM